MKVGIIGSGGREHAICQSLKVKKNKQKFTVFQVMLVQQEIAKNINLDLDNFENIKNFILEKKLILLVIGPEKPLVEGMVDYLREI